ncbi:MAG: hypothetical protein KC550_01065, partial [Nanoarchaeota archaeon]|nr:hypothetical protein [Nanoarchaeota archaeon]
NFNLQKESIDLLLFKEILIQEFLKNFPFNMHQPAKGVIIATMFSCLSLAVADRIIVKSKEQKFDVRVNFVNSEPAGKGKSFVAGSLINAVKILHKQFITGGSIHAEAFIGKNTIEEYNPFSFENYNRNKKVENVFIDKVKNKFFLNVKNKGAFAGDLFVDEEFTKWVALGNSKDGLLPIMNDALDRFGKSKVSKKLVDSPMPLSYYSHVIFVGCIQNKMVVPDYYILGVYRRCPILSAKYYDIGPDQTAFSYVLNHETYNQRFYDRLPLMREKAVGLSIKKTYNNKSVEPAYKDDYNLTKKQFDKYDDLVSVNLFDPDDWDISEYSDISIDVVAGFFVSYKAQEYFNYFKSKGIAGVEFVGKLKWYTIELFFKFAILTKIAYLTTELKQDVLNLTITEEDVKIVASDVKLILESAFEYYYTYNNPEEFSKLILHNYGPYGNWLIVNLQSKEAFDENSAIAKSKVIDDFIEGFSKSHSTFEGVLKKLFDAGVVNKISIGKKEKGKDNVFLYVNKEILQDED